RAPRPLLRRWAAEASGVERCGSVSAPSRCCTPSIMVVSLTSASLRSRVSTTETERAAHGCATLPAGRGARLRGWGSSVARLVAAAGAAASRLELADLAAAVELDPAAGAQQLAKLGAATLDARLHPG